MRVKTQHIILPNAPAVLDLPLRRWRMEICLLDQNDNEIEANILSSCTYYLHPTFKDPIRQIAAPPFALEEEGWGQFDLKIICQFIENAGKFTIKHALLFGDDAYAMDYSIRVPYHIPKLRDRLASQFNLPHNAVQDYYEKQQDSVPSNWISSIPLLDEDAVTTIVQMIASHPAVQDEIFRHPRHEDFLMALYQLPNELLKDIGEYVRRQDTT